MTQKEFETLTGMTVTAAEYSNIERVYMADGNVDKRDFCNMWKSLSEPAQDYMIEMAISKERIKNDAQVAITSLLKEKKNLLNVMFERTQTMSDPELRKECIKQMGKKEYIKRMLEEGRTLWADDKELIISLLD